MKNKKTILITIFASLFAVLTVVNMSLASPKSAGENTLDMLEIMTRAFDESEGGEGGIGDCPLYSWEELLPDIENNMCMYTGWYPCKLYWVKDGDEIAVYFYNDYMSNTYRMELACAEVVITPQ